MQNFPENEFDAWIKNSLNEPNLSFDPEAWKSMEKKLDAPLTPWYTIWMNGSSLFISALIIIYGMSLKINNSSNQKADQNKIISGQINSSYTEEFNAISTLDNLEEHNKNSFGLNINVKDNIENEQLKEATIEKGIFTENTGFNKERIYDTKTIFNENEQVKIQSIGTSSNILNNPFVLSKVFPKPYIIENTEINPLFISMENYNNDQTALVKEYKRIPKLSFNVLLSPDISSVNLSNVKGTGFNTGVLLEYYLSSRWSISTGVIKSNKVYNVQSEVGYGYPSPSQSNLQSIDAICSVLDIPINIRYNLAMMNKGSLFISSGLSTYLMLREDYEFNYKNYNTSYSDEVTVIGEYQHFFQIVNLSIGYERNLGKRLSVQAEPFLKIPYKDIGYGKVKLITTGAFLSVKYKMY